MIIGPIEHKTNTRLENLDDFERNINVIGIDDNSEDVVFIGYVHKLNTPEFSRVNTSHYGKGTNHMKEMVEYHGQNCYNPTSDNCFKKCNKCVTEED